MKDMEHSVECELAQKTKLFRENLPQYMGIRKWGTRYLPFPGFLGKISKDREKIYQILITKIKSILSCILCGDQ
jgi:hypothetical protein